MSLIFIPAVIILLQSEFILVYMGQDKEIAKSA